MLDPVYSSDVHLNMIDCLLHCIVDRTLGFCKIERQDAILHRGDTLQNMVLTAAQNTRFQATIQVSTSPAVTQAQSLPVTEEKMSTIDKIHPASRLFTDVIPYIVLVR